MSKQIKCHVFGYIYWCFRAHIINSFRDQKLMKRSMWSQTVSISTGLFPSG